MTAFDASSARRDQGNAVLDSAVLRAIQESVGDDPAFLAELIGDFLAEAPRHLETVRVALDKGDAQAMRLAAHTLKSNAATFGARRLEAACRELEELARSGEPSGAPQLVVEVEAAWEQARPALEAVQAEATG